MVLPVPGSPLTRSGRSSVNAALTAIIRSSVAMYVSVPSNRFISILPADPLCRLLLAADARKVRLAVHIHKYSGVLASYQLHIVTVPIQHRARALVAIERGELIAQCSAKGHGMPALSFVCRRCDQGAASYSVHNAFDRFRRDSGHVSERDYPSTGLARLRNAMREARTPSPRRPLQHPELAHL